MSGDEGSRAFRVKPHFATPEELPVAVLLFGIPALGLLIVW